MALDLRAWCPPWLRRVGLALLGIALITGSALLVLHQVPQGLGAQPGERAELTEQVRYWTPEQGLDEGVRTRTTEVVQADDGLGRTERIDAIPSPRGDRFSFRIDKDFSLEREPAVRASFPPTSLLGDVPEQVHIAVPWHTTEVGDAVGAIDTFWRMGAVEIDGITMVEYEARHVGQFFVTDGYVWYRSSARTAIVEPLSGLVVDYENHETLWREPQPSAFPLGLTDGLMHERERVWEATVTPTPETQDALVQQAHDNRRGHVIDLISQGLPTLLLGELLLGMGILGRPKRWLRASDA